MGFGSSLVCRRPANAARAADPFQFPPVSRRAQDHLIEQQENSGVRADRQRNGQYHEKAEARRFQQQPGSVTQVPKDAIQERQPSPFAVDFLDPLLASERAPGGQTGRVGVEALGFEFVGKRLQVKSDFVVEVALGLVPEKDRRNNLLIPQSRLVDIPLER